MNLLEQLHLMILLNPMLVTLFPVCLLFPLQSLHSEVLIKICSACSLAKDIHGVYVLICKLQLSNLSMHILCDASIN